MKKALICCFILVVTLLSAGFQLENVLIGTASAAVLLAIIVAVKKTTES